MRQLIPIEESTIEESLGSRRVFKEGETCNYPEACKLQPTLTMNSNQIINNKDKSNEDNER